jgi:hypothetical protein
MQAAVCAARVWVSRHRHTRNCAIAVRDFYHFWKARSEHSRAGKPLIVDPTDSSVVQMFFDDNIGFSKPHIVDARDVRTGESIPFADARLSHTLRARERYSGSEVLRQVRSAWAPHAHMSCHVIWMSIITFTGRARADRSPYVRAHAWDIIPTSTTSALCIANRSARNALAQFG